MNASNNANNITRDGKGNCPLCASPSVPDYAPFCSKRCADIDLHRWLSEGYAIPAAEDDSDGAPVDSEEP
jgi:hypothetical protein